MSLEILDPIYTLTYDIYPQVIWTLWIIGGLTIYLIVRAIIKFIL